MTTVYFVRHAQSDASVQDPFLRPLTEQGLRDRRLVTEFLSGREVAALFSSPYKRAVDTLADFAEKRGLPVQTVEDFREHETISDSYPDENYFPFIQKYWEDPAYKVPGDESLEELQQRNVRALERVLEAYPGKAVAIATHDVPEGICTAAPYLYATHHRAQAFWLSLSTCLPTLLGYGLGRMLWRQVPAYTMGMVTACIAGLMITISCEELIPASPGGSDRLSAMPALMAGVILVLVLRQLLG